MTIKKAPSPGLPELELVRNGILWIQRFLYEYNCVVPQPTPELGRRLHQSTMAVAPHFFAMLPWLFLNEAAMGIARLLDPARTAKQTNLSMGTMVNHCSWLQPKRKDQYLRHLDDLRGSAPALAIRNVRNKLLAHVDYETALDPAQRTTYAALERNVAMIARQLADLLDGIRPPGYPPLTHPRRERKWKGVETVLRHLAASQ